MALLEVALIFWTLAAALWWTCAGRLVARQSELERTDAQREKNAPVALPSLTVFKPCPPLGSRLGVSAGLIRALESFFQQLDAGCELLLGLNAEDRAAWEPLVRRWRADYPDAAWRVVYRSNAVVSERHANPKVAWQRELASLASGELWMWSDADIVAPAGFLRAARAEHAAHDSNHATGGLVLTHPYAVRRAPHPAGLLDALFVNVELLPGVLLLGRGRNANPRLGLGASLVFPAAEFHRRVDWDELGASLADDYVLARKFAFTRLGTGTLETITEQRSWRGAALHYLRWQKTVRWCRPAGFFAQLLLFPLLGWLSLLLCWQHPGVAILGAAMTMGMETLFARSICRRAGCAISLRRHWRVLLGWSFLRSFGWLVCWLPWPVRWNGRSWWRPRAATTPRAAAPAVGNIAAGEA